ncbi:ATP-binding cassette domain-containing protein [Amedibacillus dolichus]
MGYGRLYQDTTRKYSLGMKQRLVIGLYLVSDAKYLIMDEITN